MKRTAWLGWVMVVVFAMPLSARAANVGYDGGFFIGSDDEQFKLKINGRMQPRAEYHDSTTDAPRFSFRMRRALLIFGANIREKVDFTLVLNHSTNSQNFSQLNVAGATAAYTFSPQFVMTAGMVGLPLDMISEQSSGWSLLPEPPITMTQSDGATPFTATRESFGVPDGLGVNFAGEIKKFFYSASAVNAAESNYGFNNNRRVSVGGRMGVNVIGGVGGSQTDFAYSEKPNLTVSVGSMYQGKRTDTAFADARDGALGLAAGTSVAPVVKYLWTASGGAGFRWSGLSLQSEMYYRRTAFSSFGDLPATLQNSPLTDFGYYGLVGYYLIPKKLELGVLAGQVFREGADNNANQFGGGINYYLMGNNVKIQFAYAWQENYSDVSGTANNNVHDIRLQLQAGF